MDASEFWIKLMEEKKLSLSKVYQNDKKRNKCELSRDGIFSIPKSDSNQN